MIARLAILGLAAASALGVVSEEVRRVSAASAQVDFKLNDRLRVIWDPATCTLGRVTTLDGAERADPLVGMRWIATRFEKSVPVTTRFTEVVTRDGKPEIRYVLALEGVAEVEVAEAIDEYIHDDKSRPACWRRFRIGELPHGVVLAQSRENVGLAATRVLTRTNATWTWGEARFAKQDNAFTLVRSARLEFPQRGETIVTVIYDG